MSPLPSPGRWHYSGKQEVSHWPALVLVMGGVGSCFSSQWSCARQVSGGLPDQQEFSHPYAFPISGWNQDSSANLGRKRVTQHKHKSAGRAQAISLFHSMCFPAGRSYWRHSPGLPRVMHSSEFSSLKATFFKLLLSFWVFLSCAQASAPLSPMMMPALWPAEAWFTPYQCMRSVPWLGQWVLQTQVLGAGVKCPPETGVSAGEWPPAAFGHCERHICWSLLATLIRNTELSFACQHH